MGEKEKGQGMVIRRPPDKPRRVPLAPDEPVPPGFIPLHKITLISPFPLGRALCERGSGGWGLGNNLKAGSAGGKESTSPA